MNIPTENKKTWDEYRAEELEGARKFLAEEYDIDRCQYHIRGERYLMSGRKLVLVGKRKNDNLRVIIKISSHPLGKKEIEVQHDRSEILKKIDFAYRDLHFPNDVFYGQRDKYLIYVTEYIHEDEPFLLHTLERKFFLSLRAFEMLESVHAVAYSHSRVLRKTFEEAGADEYLSDFQKFKKNILAIDESLKKVLEDASEFFAKNTMVIETYSDFLVHDDFVPHNFRIRGDTLYLLDLAALRFGNKYETWARFINYLLLYDRTLADVLLEYVRKNRGEEEYFSLRLMRVYKIAELLQYHSGAFAQTEGNLRLLESHRIMFWRKVLSFTLEDKDIPLELAFEYKKKRDRLRSEEEKQRQKELGQL